jgi:hypothetical protein
MDEHWINSLPGAVLGYLSRLNEAAGGAPGRYRPALAGLTPDGERVALGPSCFALKTHVMLGRWGALDADLRSDWAKFIKSFQVPAAPPLRGDRFRAGAFIDPATLEPIQRRTRPWRRAAERWLWPGRLTETRRLIVSETKQAIASLAEVGERPGARFLGFPTEPRAIGRYLKAMDWSRPWGAGAHFAILCAMAALEAPLRLGHDDVKAMRRACSAFIADVADPATGCYFKGPRPDYDNLINGAMKVLTGLDWLGEPIHHAERMIDACLERAPKDEGCHLVDAVYALYRCAKQTGHRRGDVEAYCEALWPMLLGHFVAAEGGFSYHAGKSQTSYYGVRISQGLPVADIHGTILLVWAAVMMLELQGRLPQGWRAIRP